MPVIRTFVSHHGGDYAEHVAPILRRVAPFGVRPWIDKRDLGDRVGLRLDEQLREAIFKGSCSSLSLFLSKVATTRPWIDQEVCWAKERESEGFRILPIWLDPPKTVVLPPSMQAFLSERKVLWLEPYKDPRFVEKYAASVLATAGVTKDTEEITLYLGHRSEQWDAVIPLEWEALPAIDLRMDIDGADEFSPTLKEWKDIETGLRTVRKLTGKLSRLNICGQAPLGVGTIIGKVWDRCSGQRKSIELRTFNSTVEQIWSTNPEEYDRADGWSPETAKLLQLESPCSRSNKRLLVILPDARAKDYLPRVHAWNEKRREPASILCATFPREIKSPMAAQSLVRECVGAIRYLRKTSRPDTVIEIITCYPLALAPLVSYHLSKLGPIHFYDEVKKDHSYRLATVIP